MLLICCHFNPCGYRRPVDNFWRFYREIPVGAELAVMELSFDGRQEIPGSEVIYGSPDRNWMWQKERLLNLAIERHQPDRYAWLDTDLLWQEPWYDRACQMLDHCPVIQLFSRINFTDRHGQVFDSRPSLAAHKLGGVGRIATSPGGAWAARREDLPSIPFDDNIVGGGDDFFARPLFGDWSVVNARPMPEKWRHHYLREAAALYRRFRGKVGCLEATVTHLWHGDRENRRYNERYDALRDFDPAVDIRIGSNGLWEWATDKPEFSRAIRQYFEGRDEDGVTTSAARRVG